MRYNWNEWKNLCFFLVKKDLENVTSNSPKPSTLAPTNPTIHSLSEEDKKIPLSGMRSIIAQRLFESKTQIPHFYLNVEINAQPLMDLRKQANSAAGDGDNKLTVNDFILKAVANSAAAVGVAARRSDT